MRLIHSCLIAFSMYSRIPMPRTEWKKEDMRYVMCFFPLVGLVIGLVLCGWGWLAGYLRIGAGLFAGGMTVLPVLLTGGIHLAGFCDTLDALGSRQSMERKLEILKDSNCGAFAVIGCCLFFLITFCLWTEWKPDRTTLCLLALGFVWSRALSGLSVVQFPCAKTSGLLAMFSNAAAKQRTAWILMGYLVLFGGLMLLLQPVVGGAVLGTSLGMFGFYYHVSRKEFGGITGDLAGWFLQLCELVELAAVVLVQKWI